MIPQHYFTPPELHRCSADDRYDTDLLEQIIDTEIDIAAHKLKREKNMIVDISLKRHWQSSLRSTVTHMVAESIHDHVIRPEAVQKFMKQQLDGLIDHDLSHTGSPIVVSLHAPIQFSAMTRMLLFFSPFHHKNRDI